MFACLNSQRMFVGCAFVNDTQKCERKQPPEEIVGRRKKESKKERGDYVCRLWLNKLQRAEINERKEREQSRGRSRGRSSR